MTTLGMSLAAAVSAAKLEPAGMAHPSSRKDCDQGFDEGPYLKQLWTANDGAAGAPIIADGLVWTIGSHSAVHGLNPANGKEVVSIPFGASANHFPTPSVGDGLLLLPGTDQVFAFTGPAGPPPTPPRAAR